MTAYAIRQVLDQPFDDVLPRVVDALKTEGFGVLTEIDMQATLKAKLDVDFRRYRILGACNPPFAHKALLTDLEAGLAMPCNVVVFEQDGGHTVVMAIDPLQTVAAQGNPALTALATDVRDKLRRAVARLSEGA